MPGPVGKSKSSTFNKVKRGNRKTATEVQREKDAKAKAQYDKAKAENRAKRKSVSVQNKYNQAILDKIDSRRVSRGEKRIFGEIPKSKASEAKRKAMVSAAGKKYRNAKK